MGQQATATAPDDTTLREAFIQSETGELIPGVPVRIEHDSSTFCLPHDVLLAIGTSTRLTFAVGDDEARFTVAALVALRAEETDGRIYEFRHQLEEDQLAALGLASREERRRARRRRIPGPVSVQVRDMERGLTKAGTLQDLSPMGAGIALPVDADASFLECDVLQVRFELGSAPSFSFHASIRRRRLNVMTMHYGLEFDLDRTPDGHARAERLAELLNR